MNYAKYLDKKVESTYLDIGLFKDWEEGKIGTEECFDQWLHNNRPKFVKRDFEKFLNSMGYIRK